MKTFGKPSALISCVIVVSFLFDWGDGNLSEWIRPVPSGETVSAAHTWASIGAYDVRVKAKDDTAGRENDWSAAHTITIVEAPILKINWISGGLFTVKTLIRNNGGVIATNVEWSFSLSGGACIGKKTTGQIASLEPGAEQVISSKVILGFGETMVTVKASVPESADEKTQAGTLLFFFMRLENSKRVWYSEGSIKETFSL